MIIKIFFLILFASLIDCIVKEKYVKDYLWIKKYASQWVAVPNFWKDSIRNDRWYRIRWAIILNLFFIILSGLTTWSIWGSVIYLFLALCYWEHIFYQWIAGFIVKDKKFFDLYDEPIWLNSIPWGLWLAKYHEKETLTSEEVYTIAILGAGFLLIINKII